MATTRGRTPARAGRTRRALFPAVVALVLGLTGCAAGAVALPETAAPARTAAAPIGPDCLAPQVLAALGFGPDDRPRTGVHPDAPDTGPLPRDFRPVSAVLCSTGETLTDAQGRWSAVTASRLEGDVGPLVRALTRAAAEPDPTPSPACPGDRADLWLLDARGAAIRVALPAGGCDPLPDAIVRGLDALDEVDVEHSPVRLVEPAGGGVTAAP